jgi:murein DD-endopeptidase MepM/ murein hydrolase activator NlpD
MAFARNRSKRVVAGFALFVLAVAVPLGVAARELYPNIARPDFALELPFTEASIWHPWQPSSFDELDPLRADALRPYYLDQNPSDGSFTTLAVGHGAFVSQPGDTWFVYGLHGYQAAAQTLTGPTYPQWGGRHHGIDFVAVAGLPVRAAASGRVAFVGEWLGPTVIIDHWDGYQTTYSHLADVQVTVGQEVESGQAFAIVADQPTDNSHLHFALDRVYEDGSVIAINPLKFLDLGNAWVPVSGVNAFFRGSRQPAEQEDFVWKRGDYLSL